MQGSPKETYREKARSFKLETEKIKKRLSLYSLLRLLFFISAIILLVRLINENLALAILSSLATLVLLFVFVKLGGKRAARKRLLAELIRINEEELLALNWQYPGFNDGREYADPEHPNTSDLDIFGENSLFQFLERCSITIGRDQLAEWLRHPIPVDEIRKRQEAVGELSGKVDWRQEFLAKGRMSGETREDYMQIIEWIKQNPFIISNRTFRSLLTLLPLLTILSLVLSIWWIPYNIPIFLVLIQLGIVGYNLRRINHHHNQVSRKFKLINNFSSLIEQIENVEFDSEYLLDLKTGLSASGIKAGQQLQRLAKIVVQFDRRLNMIMGFVLNALLMWDLQCIIRLEKWKIGNASRVRDWFGIIGKFEALNSFACFKYNMPACIFPEISAEDEILEAESLAHPLIPEKESIGNNVSIRKKGEFMLITGSNMAGKSTFLRTIGVNMVLASSGAPVMATKMKWQPLKILTSMRVRDSLSSRESTFYAELKRLRMIIEQIQSGERILIILDEILKGTNSRDKHFGSEMFIRQLVREGSTGIIATHDLELSILEDEFPGKIVNHCFEVQINDQEFVYDYKLRRGVCQTLNATELMKKMGISIDPEN